MAGYSFHIGHYEKTNQEGYRQNTHNVTNTRMTEGLWLKIWETDYDNGRIE